MGNWPSTAELLTFTLILVSLFFAVGIGFGYMIWG